MCDEDHNILLEQIKSGEKKNIIVLVGAGISVSAGIPDFRSSNGIYEKFKKEYPSLQQEDLFDLKFFKQDPKPFSIFFNDHFTGLFNAHENKDPDSTPRAIPKPTLTHHFLKKLQDNNQLLRIYTQNIDGLEKQVGILDDKIIYTHGEIFSDAKCINCNVTLSMQKFQDYLKINGIVPACHVCKNLMKPSIVFFGEDLPNKYFQCVQKDFDDPKSKVDCLIVIGTSLKVVPVAKLPELLNKKKPKVPQLLINRELCGFWDKIDFSSYVKNTRNIYRSDNKFSILGNCDDIVSKLYL